MSEESRLLIPPSTPSGDDSPSVAQGLLDIVRHMWHFGLISLGGPTAHISMLRERYVERRKWLPPSAFTEILGICSSIPGPTSTQMVASTGAVRAGVPGALLALALFMLPAFAAMTILGFYIGNNSTVGDWRDNSFIFQSIEGGIGSASVAVIIAASYKLAAPLAGTNIYLQAYICFTCVATLFYRDWWMIPVVLLLCGGAEYVRKRRLEAANSKKASAASVSVNNSEQKPASQPQIQSAPLPLHISRFAAVVAFLLFFSLLLALMLSRHLLLPSVFWIRYCEIFFRIGCSTLGGGYVVISMLLVELVDSGLIENYQLIQAFVLSSMMPGPMFTLSAYLGAVMDGFQGAVLCWICLFAPGVLMLFVVLHAWKWMREQKIIKAALPGVNAGAIGLIIASAILLGTVIIGVDHVFWVVAILCYFVHDRCKLDVPYTILLGGVLGLALKEFHSVL